MNDKREIKIARGLHAGLLVRITRASIGVPPDTMGLVIKVHGDGPEPFDGAGRGGRITMYDIQLLGSGRTVRRMSRDLEVIQ